MNDLEAKIKARIAVLEADLVKFVADANTRITATNTVIAELKELIKPTEPEPVEK